jgi:hypothetical protein
VHKLFEELAVSILVTIITEPFVKIFSLFNIQINTGTENDSYKLSFISTITLIKCNLMMKVIISNVPSND